MKVRNILYGYCYENGKIIFHPTESEIMKEIVRKYRNGDSLLEIAKSLNNRMVEYMAGVCGWNKSRIMRLLEDRRYLGDDKYPALISEEDYNEIQKKREEKNTQKDTNRSADIFQMPIPIRCAKCNAQMRRVVNKRAIIPIRSSNSKDNVCNGRIAVKISFSRWALITELSNSAYFNEAYVIIFVRTASPSINLLSNIRVISLFNLRASMLVSISFSWGMITCSGFPITSLSNPIKSAHMFSSVFPIAVLQV